MCTKCGDFSAILGSTIGDFGDFQSANWRFLKILTWQHCSLQEMLSSFSFYEVGVTFSCCLYWFLKTILSAFSFHEIRTTFLGCLYFQVVICINIWKINVVRIFFWWNADNISSCPHVVRLSVVVRILSIPLHSIFSQCRIYEDLLLIKYLSAKL